MTTPHVSDLSWDRLHAGHLAPALAAEARQHAAACPSCATRGAALEVAHRRFVAAPPSLRARPRPARARLAPALATAAVAIAAVFWLAAREPREPIRSKGGFAVTAFAGRDGDAVPLGAGDPIFPGDRLQLSYSAPRAGYLAVLAVDGAGQVNVYFPAHGITAWAAAAGHRIALPSSTELDGVVGEERVWVAFCDQPQPLAPLSAALVERGVAAEPPVGCEIQRLRFDKRVRPTGGGR